MAERILAIMAGGSGERFWPLSRPERPKQLLNLTSPHETMLEEAVHRSQRVVGAGNVYIATSAALYEPVVEADIVPQSRVLAEPDRRNTLGCLCWLAANLIAQGLGDATVGTLTADHRIEEPDRFTASINDALDLAESQNGIVCLGIQPDRPETGYGYIEADSATQYPCTSGRIAFGSKGFREKPSLEVAQSFLAAGHFFWNGGMFFVTVPRLLEEIRLALPEAEAIVHEMADALARNRFFEAAEAFRRLPSISFDYAVMEKAERVFVLPADFPWDDVGSWDSLDRSFPADEDGNVLRGSSVVLDTRNTIVVNDAPDHLQVGVLGVEGLVIVATKDSILVTTKEHAQRVREITQQLPKKN